MNPTDHRSLRCGRAGGDVRLQPDRVQRHVRQQGAGTITVNSTDDACELSTTKAPSGNVAFKVKNAG